MRGWLRVGTDHVHVDYDTGEGLGLCRPDLHVTKISYAYNDEKTPLYEVDLAYDGWWRADGAVGTVCDRRPGETAAVFDRSADDMLPTDRSTIVTSIAVKARNNLDRKSLPKVIRSYELKYAPDLDTDKPRLSVVVFHGEDGVGSEPVATYDYGSLARPDEKIHFGEPVKVPRSANLPATYADDLSANDQG
ncbi:MAG: hypothetical protein IPL61_17120 [Myxococcales bacterium]|nr:hypothetical protein [Myxococcales bacterium]